MIKKEDKHQETTLDLSISDKNNIRVRKFIEAERLIAFSEYNKGKSWWNIKSFDYDVFLAGFVSGLRFGNRKDFLEIEKEVKRE